MGATARALNVCGGMAQWLQPRWQWQACIRREGRRKMQQQQVLVGAGAVGEVAVQVEVSGQELRLLLPPLQKKKKCLLEAVAVAANTVSGHLAPLVSLLGSLGGGE